MKPSTPKEAWQQIADSLDEVMVSLIADDIDLDRILACCAEMRGYMVQMSQTILIDIPNDQPRVYADELQPSDRPKQFTDDPKPGKLPKLKPQGHDKVKYKPGITKMLRKAIEFDCPSCGAVAGTNCFKFTGPGTHTQVTTERNNGQHFHTKRSDLSTAANDRIRKQNILH